MPERKRIAVVGSGCAGLAAAYALDKHGHDVWMYEKDEHVGGHAHTQMVGDVPVDTGFMVCNHVTYPTMLQWFEQEGVRIQPSDMSLSVSLEDGGFEWGSNGLGALFAQRSNCASPSFWRMLREMFTFQRDAEAFLADPPDDRNSVSLGQFLSARRYSSYFVERYLVPACASIWSVPAATVHESPAFFILEFMKNHHMLSVFSRPQWYTVAGRSADGYVAKVTKAFAHKIRTGSEVVGASASGDGDAARWTLHFAAADQSDEAFDHVVFACHAPDAKAILGDAASAEQAEFLGAFQYQLSTIYLHQDAALMPTRRACWSAWNFLGAEDAARGVVVTYHLNTLQSLSKEHPDVGDVFVTLNPATPPAPSTVASKWQTSHPVPSMAARDAAATADAVQGERALWFAGAYLG